MLTRLCESKLNDVRDISCIRGSLFWTVMMSHLYSWWHCWVSWQQATAF